MKTILTILLLLSSTPNANAWDYYHDDPNAALLDLALGSFAGYDQMYGAYQNDGTNMLFHQYANDSDYTSAFKSKWDHSPNSWDMANYHNAMGFIDSYEKTQRALSGIYSSWNNSGLSDFTTSPYNHLGFPNSSFGSASSSSLSESFQFFDHP